MAKCQHNNEIYDVYGKKECEECVLEKLAIPLRKYSELIEQGMPQEESLLSVMNEFSLPRRDVLLMGWVWGEWIERTGA